MRNEKAYTEWAAPEVKISYKPAKHAFKITGSQSASQVFQNIWDQQLLHIQEQFYVLFLNHANQVMCWRLIGTGTAKNVVVDRKIIATIVCNTLTQSVVIAHNHPSGNLKPSKADKNFTWELQQMLNLLEVKLIDHLIITAHGYFSFADEGLIYNPENF